MVSRSCKTDIAKLIVPLIMERAAPKGNAVKVFDGPYASEFGALQKKAKTAHQPKACR